MAATTAGTPAGPSTVWSALFADAEAQGLNVAVAVPREAIEGAFAQAAARQAEHGLGAGLPVTAPRMLHPGYRTAVVLGSAGRAFWESFRAATADLRGNDPLDRHTARVADALLEHLRKEDPKAQAAFPFNHARRIVPFMALTGHLPWARPQPFGLAVHPRFGPWFAWRAALLTQLAPPAAPKAEANPCAACPAPCVEACPAGAVDKGGFHWPDCISFRRDQAPCRETCLSRETCPAGAEFRYGRDQLAYHYTASLRMIEEGRV